VEAAVGALTDPSANEALQLTLLESGGAYQLHQPTQPPQSPQQPSGTCNVGGNQGGGAGSSRVSSDATASAAADPGGSNLEVTAGAGGGGGESGQKGAAAPSPELSQSQVAAIDSSGLQEALRHTERSYEAVDLRLEAAALRIYLAAAAPGAGGGS